jgi:integral membrane protein (TIGR01906 family)
MSEENREIKKQDSILIKVMGWLVSLLVPVVLVLSMIRVLMLPAFLQIEYRMPGFPDDFYGFTLEDRLYWSRYALDYLLNNEAINYLGDLTFEDGSLVFNQRELKHMVDVQIALNAVVRVWRFSLIVTFILGVWAWNSGWFNRYLYALSRGGWLTVFLLAALIFFMLLSFGVFFVAFHNVFFEPGTWVFYYSDTLIRLFPERFWRDIFLYVGGFAIISGLALGWGLKVKD